MSEFLQRLRERKLVQWALAYGAGAWVLLQGLGLLAATFDWSPLVMRIAVGIALIGFLATLVLAWYHGERGEQRATRIELLILALLMAGGGALLWHFARSTQSPASVSRTVALTGSAVPPPSAKSIAVLPFLNMSGDAKNDYFSDGITEEILNALAQVPDLKVAARTSAFAFKGKNEDLRKVGEALDVATVLEGSVQTSGDQVRITAQLIDTRSGFHLWSEKYDRKLSDIFAVEDDISKAIADKLQAQLGTRTQSVAANTRDPRAHDFYLRGLTQLAARGPALRDAVVNFQQAVVIDPAYAAAWAESAQAEVLIKVWYLDTEGTALKHAESDAQRALSLDPNLASAYVALGMLHRARWEWADADEALRRAVALAPRDAEAIDQYAQFLFSVGQMEPALREIERAQQIDPLSGVIGGTHAEILMDLRRCDQASAQIARTLASASDNRYLRGVAYEVAIYCKRYAYAETQARQFAVLMGRDPDVYAALVRGVANPDHRLAAVELAKAIHKVDAKLPMYTAFWLISLGDRDDALAVIEEYAAKGPAPNEEKLWLPAFDPVRDDPRFKKALARIGIPWQPASIELKTAH